mgnify:CR=1 FL=1
MQVELVVGDPPSPEQPAGDGMVEQTLGMSRNESESSAAILTAAEEDHL